MIHVTSSTANKDRSNRLSEDSPWSKIDIFELRFITHKIVLQIFYIIFLICLLLLLVSVILLLIPKNNGDNQNQTALEENILLWTYSKVESSFKDASIKFDFSQSSAINIGEIKLAYKTDYDYPLDNYYPTYEDRTHVYDITKVAAAKS